MIVTNHLPYSGDKHHIDTWLPCIVDHIREEHPDIDLGKPGVIVIREFPFTAICRQWTLEAIHFDSGHAIGSPEMLQRLEYKILSN